MPIEYSTANTFRYATVEQLKPVLEVLVHIAWPCPDGNIPDIIDRLGWTLTSDRVYIDADTGLPFNWRLGKFGRSHGEFTHLSFPVSDAVEKDGIKGVRALFRGRFP